MPPEAAPHLQYSPKTAANVHDGSISVKRILRVDRRKVSLKQNPSVKPHPEPALHSHTAYPHHPTKNTEEEGFEPPDPFESTVFKTAALNHSATPPDTHPPGRSPGHARFQARRSLTIIERCALKSTGFRRAPVRITGQSGPPPGSAAAPSAPAHSHPHPDSSRESPPAFVPPPDLIH